MAEQDPAGDRRGRGAYGVIQRAEQDPAFRSALLTDPKQALAQAFGVSIPDGITIRVVEDTDDTVYLVLPRPPAVSGRISDQELSQIAGGHCGVSFPW